MSIVTSRAFARLRRIGLDVLPPVVSRAVIRHMVRRFGPPLQPGKIAGVRMPRPVVRNQSELDEAIRCADEAGAVSDDALRQVLASFRYEYQRALPADPFSEAYRLAQFEIYRHISGREHYDAARDEAMPIQVDDVLRHPFPYGTQSTHTIGEQLIMQGFVLRALGLKPGASVLEFGPGWGNTTLHLAQAGFKVTAVDVFADYLELIQRRAAQIGAHVETIQRDMLEYRDERSFDAVLFFECFHHCADHLRMLRQLHDLVADDGVVVFGAEPIGPMTMPWGIRTDGMSVWSIRKFGWFELGFEPDYFGAALKRTGWTTTSATSGDVPNCMVYVARKQPR